MTVANLINLIDDKNYAGATSVFKDLVAEKTRVALDGEKEAVAKRIFGEAEEE